MAFSKTVRLQRIPKSKWDPMRRLTWKDKNIELRGVSVDVGYASPFLSVGEGRDEKVFY